MIVDNYATSNSTALCYESVHLLLVFNACILCAIGPRCITSHCIIITVKTWHIGGEWVFICSLYVKFHSHGTLMASRELVFALFTTCF